MICVCDMDLAIRSLLCDKLWSYDTQFYEKVQLQFFKGGTGGVSKDNHDPRS